MRERVKALEDIVGRDMAELFDVERLGFIPRMFIPRIRESAQ
jgi:hypothetical protein